MCVVYIGVCAHACMYGVYTYVRACVHILNVVCLCVWCICVCVCVHVRVCVYLNYTHSILILVGGSYCDSPGSVTPLSAVVRCIMGQFRGGLSKLNLKSK